MGPINLVEVGIFFLLLVEKWAKMASLSLPALSGTLPIAKFVNHLRSGGNKSIDCACGGEPGKHGLD